MAAATQQKQAASIIKMVQWQVKWCWQQMLPCSKWQQQDVFIANQCDNQVLPAAATKGGKDHRRRQHCGTVVL